MDSIITQNTRHIWKTTVMAKEYLRQQILKSTGCLEDTVTDTDSIKHNRAFNLYTACTQVNRYHSDKWEDKIADQQNKVVGGDTDVIDGRQDHNNRYEASKARVIQN